MNIPLPAPRRVHILYVGRNTAAFDALASHALAFGPPNDPPNDAVLHKDGTSNGASPPTRPDPLPPVEFETVRSQKQALDYVRTRPPHMVVVEVTGAPNSCVRFCETLRYRLPAAILVAVSKDEIRSPFPFDVTLSIPVDVALARDALSAHITELESRQLKLGHIQLDATRRTVQTHSGLHHMTPKQCALLKLLMVNHGDVVHRTHIMQSIWETSYMDDTRTLDVHIRWLRERIEPVPSEPVYLTTIRGIGYCLDVLG